MPVLDLTFLGTFSVTLDGRPITKFRSANVRGLLAYLTMRGNRPAERERLATLFWPEESESVAKTNLRQAVYHLRNALDDKNADPPFLLVDRRSVALNPAAEVQVDVVRFLQAVDGDDLEAAGILFTGELLPGFVCDSAGFEGWLRQEREKLNRSALDVLSRLTEAKLVENDYSAAKSAALRQLDIEPWREMAHYQLMQALALSGEREAAIAQFEQLEDILEREMGISPQQETFDLIQWIENNEGSQTFNSAIFKSAAPYQAPAVPDYLVGRDFEIESISQLLTNPDNKKPIVGLVGMGGIGKTTLASAVARQLRSEFPDGVLWGNMLLSTAENILEMWAQAYGYDFSNIADLESLATAVRGILADKKVLIVLDNVTERSDNQLMLQTGEGCAMLITTRSRDAAAAVGAHIFPVQELTSEFSVSLIEQIIERDNLLEHEANQQAAEKIGELLDHLPLAVEITAQLLKARPRMTLTGMVERLQNAQQRRGLKISNKAVRTSFELSWEFLPPELRTLFSNIGVFEGRSFPFEALQAVCDTDPFDTEDDLYSLVSRSLVQLDGENRFKQHPLLADFAAEKLEDKEPVLTKLIDYYLEFSKNNALNFDGLQPEWDNLLAIAHGMAELGDGQSLLALTDTLHDSWFRYGRFSDGNQIYALAESAAKQFGSVKDPNEQLVKTLIRWSEMGLEQSDYDAVWDRLETALPIAYQLEDDSAVGQIKYLQGYVLFDQGEYGAAEKLAEESINLFSEQKEKLKEAKSIDLLSSIYYDCDDSLHRAENSLNKSLALFAQLGESPDKVSALRLQSAIKYRQKKYEEAEFIANKALKLSQQFKSKGEELASLYLLIGIYQITNRFTEIKKISSTALALARKTGLIRNECLIQHELSAALIKNGEAHLAKEITENNLEVFQRIHDRLNYGFALRQMGDIYQNLGQPELSQQHWKRALDIALFLENNQLLEQLQQRMSST